MREQMPKHDGEARDERKRIDRARKPALLREPEEREACAGDDREGDGEERGEHEEEECRGSGAEKKTRRAAPKALRALIAFLQLKCV